MNKKQIRKMVAGNPQNGIPGLQDDWWTEISPDLWNSHGSYIKDVSGEEYLDFNGFFSSSPVSFNHPRLRNDSFLKKITRAAVYRPTLSDFWTAEFAEFTETFRKVAVPPHLHHFFFIDSGALAVENGLKAAFDWKVRLNILKGKIKNDPQEEKRPLGTKIIYFENGFHGRSGYTLSLTHTNDPNKYKYFPKFDWFKVEPPVMEFNNQGSVINKDTTEKKQKEAEKELRNILQQHGDDIAAIIIEPIQCEGGDRYIPSEFFAALRKLADEFDVLIIYDEVQTGFGATGMMWAHEYFGKEALPDIITFSKKAQTGGILASFDKFSRIKENVFGNHDECKSRINSTWGGNIVDMVRCDEFLKIIHEENLLQKAGENGKYLLNGIRELCGKYHDYFSSPRGRGMMIGFDVISEKFTNKDLCSALKKENCLCLYCGEKTVRLRPHLDITREEIDDGLNRMKKAISGIV